MRPQSIAAVLLILAALHAPAARAADPDYSKWTEILQKYYDPAKGMDYAGLKGQQQVIQSLREQLGRVNVAALTPKERLAYWMNVYNINTVATILENYPVKSIRDISTDPIVRLNVFKKDRVPFGSARLSLNDVENDKIRAAFKDPRIHFAINCAAKSCPPLRTEAFTGAQVDGQLDDQTRKFLNGPLGARFQKRGETLVVRVTKIMDWFGDDFDQWGGGKLAFIRRFLTPERQKQIVGSKVSFDYDDYDWSLNDWKR